MTSEVAAEPEIEEGLRLPWTSRALGLNDLGLASARSDARLVAVVGPHNAGKTSLLTAMFAHFAESGKIGDHCFAGSFTLQGWSRLRGHTQWPSLPGMTFPPHTPANSERVPSLLHLALRAGDSAIKDVLFTDAPGEWFSRWVRNRDSDEAKGARWIAEHATHFVFVIDREDLAGEDGGLVKQKTLGLARVLNEQRNGRPILVIWAKSDKTPDLEMEAPVRRGLLDFFGEHRSLDLSVDDPQCLELLKLALSEPLPPGASIRLPVAQGTSAFLAFQGGSQ